MAGARQVLWSRLDQQDLKQKNRQPWSGHVFRLLTLLRQPHPGSDLASHECLLPLPADHSMSLRSSCILAPHRILWAGHGHDMRARLMDICTLPYFMLPALLDSRGIPNAHHVRSPLLGLFHQPLEGCASRPKKSQEWRMSEVSLYCNHATHPLLNCSCMRVTS